MEKDFVTLEAFEYYDKKIKEYISMRDGMTIDGKIICSKCGSVITGEKCENCSLEE